jgi:hypothetical protein
LIGLVAGALLPAMAFSYTTVFRSAFTTFGSSNQPESRPVITIVRCVSMVACRPEATVTSAFIGSQVRRWRAGQQYLSSARLSGWDIAVRMGRSALRPAFRSASVWTLGEIRQRRHR